MLDTTAKMPGSMLISCILYTLTYDDLFRFNNIWDAMPAKEQTIRKLTELLKLLEVRIERRSNDADNYVALKTSAGNKGFPDKAAYQPSGNKRCLVPDKTAYQQSKRYFVCRSPDHFIKDCTDP